MHIARPKLDAAAIRQRLELTLSGIPTFLAGARRNPSNLPLLLSNARDVSFGTAVLDPKSPDILRYLRLSGQAGAALFAVAAAGGKPVEVPLGEDVAVLYEAPVDASIVHAARWIESFCLAAAARDSASLDLLCAVPTALLAAGPTRNPEYRSLLVEALKGLHAGAPDTGKRILAAMGATDPQRDDILKPDWVLYVDVPLLELLFYVNSQDPDFAPALEKALTLHKKYWTQPAGQKKKWEGYLAVPSLAMAALAHDRGLSFSVTSDYLPPSVLRPT